VLTTSLVRRIADVGWEAGKNPITGEAASDTKAGWEARGKHRRPVIPHILVAGTPSPAWRAPFSGAGAPRPLAGLLRG
jgi:hypothetical protein